MRLVVAEIPSDDEDQIQGLRMWVRANVHGFYVSNGGSAYFIEDEIEADIFEAAWHADQWPAHLNEPVDDAALNKEVKSRIRSWDWFQEHPLHAQRQRQAAAQAQPQSQPSDTRGPPPVTQEGQPLTWEQYLKKRFRDDPHGISAESREVDEALRSYWDILWRWPDGSPVDGVFYYNYGAAKKAARKYGFLLPEQNASNHERWKELMQNGQQPFAHDLVWRNQAPGFNTEKVMP